MRDYAPAGVAWLHVVVEHTEVSLDDAAGARLPAKYAQARQSLGAKP